MRRTRKFWTKYWCQFLEFSRSIVFSCRSNLIINSDTSRQLGRIFLVLRLSISAHDTALESSWKITSNLVSVSVLPSQRVSPCSLHVSLFRHLPYVLVYPVHDPHTWTSSIAKKSWSWSRLRNGLDDNWRLHAELHRSLCFHGSILSLGMIYHFEVMCTLDMNLSVCQVQCHQVSWNTVLFQQSSRDLHWSRVWSLEDELEDLRIFVHNRAANLPVLSHRSKRFDLLTTILLALPWSPNRSVLRVSPCTLWTFGDFPSWLFTHVRCCSVDTELIDGNNCGQRNDQCPCAKLLAYSVKLRNSQSTILCFRFLSIRCRCTVSRRRSVLGIARIRALFQSACFESRRWSAMW